MYHSWGIRIDSSLGPSSTHRICTFSLVQIAADGQQVVSVQGMAVLLPFCGMYHIYWKVWVVLPFHHKLPVFPLPLDLMPALDGGNTDKNHVSRPQGYCLAMSVVILFLVLGLHLLVKVSLFIGPLDTVPQFLDIFSRSGC